MKKQRETRPSAALQDQSSTGSLVTPAVCSSPRWILTLDSLRGFLLVFLHITNLSRSYWANIEQIRILNVVKLSRIFITCFLKVKPAWAHRWCHVAQKPAAWGIPLPVPRGRDSGLLKSLAAWAGVEWIVAVRVAGQKRLSPSVRETMQELILLFCPNDLQRPVFKFNFPATETQNLLFLQVKAKMLSVSYSNFI